MQEYLPQTITNDLLKKLSPYDRETQLSEFEAKKFLREAKKLDKSYPSEFFMLSGVIHSLEGDYDKTVNAFESALRNSTDDYEPILLNYAVVLRNLGKYSEAFQVIDDNYFEGSKELAEQAFFASLGVGLFKKALSYDEKLKQFSSYDEDRATYINWVLDSCKSLGVNDSELHEIYSLVLNSTYKYKKDPLTSNVVNSEDGESLLLLLNVDTDATTLSKISLDIASVLAVSKLPAIVDYKITPVILKGTK